ncbi:MAG: sigma-54-dependent Fis family transcriptional regulator [Acidobacteria bacterium]|nr:sigma-54-dependent Fis family transcriptional regulator [Acidobacteriota bacterium]
MQPLNILIIEDGASQREVLRDFLQSRGHRAFTAGNGPEGLECARGQCLDLVLVDYKMPGMDGLTVLEKLRQLNPETPAVMMTAYGTIETAVKAMKAGAMDYLTKPVDLELLLILLRRVSDRRTLERENRLLREELVRKGGEAVPLVHRSAVMAEVVNLAGRVAASNATVLIQGESGTGKELLARLIHALSPRSARPMVTVNCAALTESLLESELFGHERGSFTGADRRRIGRFEEADGSTLFMDEIGELRPPVQVKLLRFLQEREFQRVGGNQTLTADVRVLSATNQDLKARVKAGEFREDLYYRLNVVTLDIPPLRERREDLPPLVEHYLRHFAAENRKSVTGLTAAARNLLLKYDYPGNIRELRNILERAVVIARETLLTPRDLPFGEPSAEPSAGPAAGPPGEAGPASAAGAGGDLPTLRIAVERVERDLIHRALERCDGHQVRAAELLGLSERMLRYKLQKYRVK